MPNLGQLGQFGETFVFQLNKRNLEVGSVLGIVAQQGIWLVFKPLSSVPTSAAHWGKKRQSVFKTQILQSYCT